MYLRLVYTCVCLSVCVSVTYGLRASRRDERQKSRAVAATAGFNTPVHPAPSAQCLVNGIFLFEGAVWSPDACNMCQCRNGAVQCHGVPCLDIALPASRLQDGHQKPARGVKLVKTSGQKKVYPQTGKKKASQGKVIVKVKPETARKRPVKAPPPAQKKHAPPPPPPPPRPKMKQQAPEVGIGNFPVAARQDTFPDLFDYDDHDDDDYLEDDSDADEDDDDVPVLRNSRTKSSSVSRNAASLARKPAISVLQRPLPPPTKQPRLLAPSGGVRAGGGVVRGRGGGANVVGRPVIRPSTYMASLPAGCLLSDALIACGSTGLTSLPLIKDAGIRTLYLADNKISKIPMRALHGLPNLQWLDLSKNKLDDTSLGLDVFRNLTKLRRLNLDGNNLTKIPPLPPSLLELKINDNKLSGLTPHSFKGLSQLLTLELEDNHFHDGNVSPLAFRHLKKLIYLRLDDNDFRAIPSGLPASLKELHLSDNRIEVVHAGLLNKTVNLRILNLSHNKIREDRIAPRAWIHLRKLETLDLSHNKLVHVPSFLPVGLVQLTLHHNQIERIPGYVFAHMQPGLVSIHLSYNRLREDGINEVSFLGLQHSLNELLLDHNQLREIPRGIVQLRALHVLRLNHNYISSVPVNALCDITARDDSPLLSVHLQNNLIDRRLVPPTALTCIKEYSSVILHPQRHEQVYE
ncbi:extracellular matrix protein 2 isoform X2 [Pangasianodon hypophthalmus]|uniref:extracellular matrix protein 2 isoform X2 n=1 Tax=Pangasianodon hypophthalmus TaxID=310915 RepID=UPI002306F70B|nr:extracellular matrix protein 2 isoform X2 [Pangasianodon hypophthalmus]